MQSQNILFSGILSTERTWMEQESTLTVILKKIIAIGESQKQCGLTFGLSPVYSSEITSFCQL